MFCVELTATPYADQGLDKLRDRNTHLSVRLRNIRASACDRYHRQNSAKRDVRPALHHRLHHAQYIATKLAVILQRPGKRKEILGRTVINVVAAEDIVKIGDVVAEARNGLLGIRKEIHGILLDAIGARTVTCI